jgi:hypothetical protein
MNALVLMETEGEYDCATDYVVAVYLRETPFDSVKIFRDYGKYVKERTAMLRREEKRLAKERGIKRVTTAFTLQIIEEFNLQLKTQDEYLAELGFKKCEFNTYNF